MEPQKQEAILRKRAKPSKRSPNPLISLLLKFFKYKEGPIEIPPIDTSTSIDEKENEQRNVFPSKEEKNVVSDPLGIIVEEKEAATKQGAFFEGQEEAAQGEVTGINKTLLPAKELLKDLDEIIENRELADIKQRLGVLEEKVAILESILISLEEKLGPSGRTELESGSKMDLQTLLSNIDQKPGIS